MCGRYFLELKALMELEKCVDYEFERELLIAKDYYPGNEVPIIVSYDNRLDLKRARSVSYTHLDVYKRQLLLY